MSSTIQASPLPQEEDDDDVAGVFATAQTTKRRSNIPSLVAAFSASLTTGGTTYAFGLYGNDLKRSLHLTAGEVDTISTAFFVAGLFSWIPGLCVDRFGTRFSISWGGVQGAVALLCYWFVSKQMIELPRNSLVPILSILGVSVFLSSALVTGSVFKIIVSTCGAGTKGSAVGAAKGYVGLGAGAYACLFEAIRMPGETNLDFLPMAAFFAIFAATVPACLLLPSHREMKSDIISDDATPRHFHILYGSLVVMAALVIGNSIVSLMAKGGSGDDASPDGSQVNVTDAVMVREDSTTNSATDPHRHLAMAMLLVTVWLAPIASLLYIPRRRQSQHQMVSVLEDDEYCDDVSDHNQLRDTDEPSSSQTEDGGGDNSTRGDISLHKLPADVRSEDDDDESDALDLSRRRQQEERGLLGSEADGPLSPPSGVPEGDGTDLSNTTAQTSSNDEENLNLLQMLRTPSALLMLWTTTILVGAGTVETNNMGEMVEALGFPEAVTSASLALFSVAQAGGRVATGAVSEAALNWNTRRFCIDNGVPRPFFLIVASCVGVMSHFILGVASHEFFFVLGATLAGAAFGMVWPLMVLICGEVFGTANAGANYMFYDGFTSAAGTFLLTKVLSQQVYESHVDPSAQEDDDDTCYGSGCFQMTHMMVALLSLTCVGTSAAMLFTSRHTYNKSSLHRA